MTSLQEQLAKAESALTQMTDERDKAQIALKRLTDEVKAKEEQWTAESQVRWEIHFVLGDDSLSYVVFVCMFAYI